MKSDFNPIKGDLVFKRTEEEIRECEKCKNDILYFAEKYCKLMTPEGIKNVSLRNFQKKYLKYLEENSISLKRKRLSKKNDMVHFCNKCRS